MDGVHVIVGRAGGRALATVPLRDSAGARGDDAELARRAGDDGYLFFRGLLARGDVARLEAEVVQRCRARGWLEAPDAPSARLGRYDDARWIAFLQEIAVLPSFGELASAPAVVAVLRAVMGAPPVRAAGDLCRLVSPGTDDLTTPPHQDAHYLRGAAGLWTVWLPLGDCPLELGPLAVLPGSHRLGLLAHAETGPTGLGGAPPFDDYDWAAEGFAAGDVLMFEGLTLHRALDNTTRDRLRMSVDYRYVPAKLV